MRELKIGILGFGTIGTGVIKILTRRAAQLEEKTGIRLRLKKVCDNDLKRVRPVKLRPGILTADVAEVLDDPEIQVVIELIGGRTSAREFILRALANGKHVVTANKALLAECGDEIFKAARRAGKTVMFEASVGGAVPIIRTIRESLSPDNIRHLFGIVNGTSNFILSEMSRECCSFRDALHRARKSGYAERNPELDVNGIDSAHKLALLTRLCFRQNINLKSIHVEGIKNIDLLDIQNADKFGFRIKLLAIARDLGKELDVRVHPTLVPKSHLLAGIDGVFNAFYVNSDLVGDLLLYGPGAGESPTAEAVVSDILAIGGMNPISPRNDFETLGKAKPVKKIADIFTRYYIRLNAVDKPGVLAEVAQVLGNHRISIRSVSQKGRRQGKAVPIIMMTHLASEKSLRKALYEVNRLPVINSVPVAIRIEDFGDFNDS